MPLAADALELRDNAAVRTVVVASGDRDFAMAIEALHMAGKWVVVLGVHHALSGRRPTARRGVAPPRRSVRNCRRNSGGCRG